MLVSISFLGKTDATQVIALHLLFGLAVFANGADETLREHRFDGGGDEERLDAHVDQTGKCARRVIGVQRAEDQVTGERRANGDFGGFKVANFADHDHVGVLAQNVAQTHRECQSDIGAHGDLVDAFEFVFDRFFNRDDTFGDRIDRAEKRVKRR